MICKNKHLIIFLAITIPYLMACKPGDTALQDIKTLRDDLYFLASDSLEGREVGTPSEKKAAGYIAKRFSDIGLEPEGEEGYFQDFHFTPRQNPHQSPEKNDSAGVTGRNVIGFIDNLQPTTVVIGAHYDHLGLGGQGSLHRGEKMIHNGADDNASGIVSLLLLAEKFMDKKSSNNYLFIAFSGEEKGLYGSNYYTKNPTIDLRKVNYMINLDMVGRLDEENTLAINGTGTSPEWMPAIESIGMDSLKIVTRESGIGPSDHTSFYLKDIPVLHFFTGTHEDYHKPTDDADKINYGGLYAVTAFIDSLVTALDDNQKLAFTRTKDESRDTPRFKVTLGVVPDYLFDGKGMRIDGVSDDRPAQKAGLQAGDVVIKLGDTEVTDMMSYMTALSNFSQDDTTTVVVRRGVEELSYPIKF
ncbi:MAG: M28 family peptidase [Cyclobacteriaceae bacterium]|nr:M28 family peptidase [Cyclobacteriaceae bacterium]